MPENKDQTETPTRGQTVTKASLSGRPSETGTIGKIIGSGENARNSFIWVTIRYSFIAAFIFSAALYFQQQYCKVDEASHFIENLKGIWSIFLPIITLALGYAFGKGK